MNNNDQINDLFKNFTELLYIADCEIERILNNGSVGPKPYNERPAFNGFKHLYAFEKEINMRLRSIILELKSITLQMSRLV
jgi:hypothetical protein